MFAYCSRDEKFSHFFTIAKSLKIMVARDGIEPPTPAFSGPLTESPKWFENQWMSLSMPDVSAVNATDVQLGIGT